MTTDDKIDPAASPLLVHRSGATVTLRFNRPAAMNAADRRLAEAFLVQCRELTADPTVRAIVIAGSGRAFMAGGDLDALRADPQGAASMLIEPLHEAIELLARGNAPVIASVHGAVAGAGLSIMLQADYVVAADACRFSFAYSGIGTSCDLGASWALPRIVGQRKALEIALLGDSFDSAEALRIGIVNRVVPASDLEVQSQQIASRLANGPTLALGELRRLMRSGFDRSLHEQLREEAAAFSRCAASADFSEGVDAFFARRSPAFRGS